MSLLVLTAYMIFAGVFLFTIYITGSTYQEQVQVKLEKFLGKQKEKTGSSLQEKKGNGSRKILELIGKTLAPGGLKKKLEEELSRADILLKGEEFVGLTILTFFGPGIISLALTANLPFAVMTACLGGFLPFYVIKVKQNKRRLKFNAQIGDALLIMANALRSGFSFLQAMDMVRREMPDPIAREFGIVLLEMNWGNSTETALLDLAGRIKSDDLDLLITAVLIQRQVGGNLAEILDNIAHTIKERVRIKGEIKTLTAQGRISGLIIGLLPVVLGTVIFLLNPGYLSLLFSTRTGVFMLTGAILGQLMGVMIIRRIISIEI
ncbi:type II secretion system F family protein [Moorella sulfitireducens]|uniref:type II secretion system F family protein n=1 Tax=Neomoorella sulfitireducens TaxID=2972948 RepID=UPI0021AC0601|nr:type II secretion system F family protein [Moorella sulfitireducens]